MPMQDHSRSDKAAANSEKPGQRGIFEFPENNARKN